jgi:hypothetical protein
MKLFLSLILSLILSLGFLSPVQAQDAGIEAADVAVAEETSADASAELAEEAKPEAAEAVGVKAPEGIVGMPNPEDVPPVATAKEDAAADPAVPEDPKEVAENVTFMIRAAKNGQWALFAGFLILLLIWGANKAGLKEKVGAKALPWICVALGVLSSIGVMLVSGIAVDEAIVAGIMAGLTATGGWELLFKHLLKKTDPEPESKTP